ncbi:MAG: cytochrome oxidase [Hyphomicrobiales bacterium]|nr:MAG: cytochrome oxidase [Hyphomicrobiales bacterium]
MTMATKTKEFTGRHMWLVVCAFFGTIITVNIGMAVVSSTSWTGLVVQNSYVASQEFEGKRIAHEAQVAAGWDATFTYAPGRISLAVIDGAGQPVDLGTVTLKVNRPVGGHDDQALTFERAPDGSYAAPLTLATGVWDALVQAPATVEGPFELHKRFSVGAR